VVEPRYEELFKLILEDLRRSGFEEQLAAGIVLTGGTSKMQGVVELAEEIFHLPVRVGSPSRVNGLSDIVKNPIYSTGVGLLHFGALEQQRLSETGLLRNQTKGFFDSITKFFRDDE